MFVTGASLPAGYGYNKVPSVADENIMPALIEHLKTEDKGNQGCPIILHHVDIYVDKVANISINGRSPVMVEVEHPLCFDCSAVTSIAFKESGINYNIIVSY